MSTITEKELEYYCKQIRHCIPGSSKDKGQILRGLQIGIEEYREQHPHATFEDIQKQFGKPAEIALEYFPAITPKEMQQFTRRKKIIIGLSLGLAVVILFSIVIYFFSVWKTPGVIKESGQFEEPSSNTSVVVEIY